MNDWDKKLDEDLERMPKGFEGMLEADLKGVKAYFRICPLCFTEDSVKFEIEERWGGLGTKIYVLCRNCGGESGILDSAHGQETLRAHSL